LQNIGFRLLDENIVGLDETTIESYSNVMLTLQENTQQLLVISHITSVKDLFEDKIKITKINGESKII
jgi:DNA repair exonuclease SbcCD ATPase subunit